MIHLPDGSSLPLKNSFMTLYAGVYYFDFTPRQEGTHVFQISVFNGRCFIQRLCCNTCFESKSWWINKEIIKLNSILGDF